MKKCTKCGVEKVEEDFYKKQGVQTGSDASCKSCKLSYAVEYRRNNRELLSKKQSSYAKLNKHKLAPKQAVYREKNKQSIAEKKRLDYLKDPQKVIRRSAEWVATHPEVHKAHFQNTRARKRGVAGCLSMSIVTKLLKDQKGCCGLCQLPLNKPFHIDHKVPISKGGLNIDSNVQLVHPLCNARKGSRPHDEFVAKLLKEKETA